MDKFQTKAGTATVGNIGKLDEQISAPQTPYPGTPDGSLPIEYQNVLDPLETLTYVAGITNRIALGTCVIDMLFHNPVVLARRFATLDILSEGRTICGLGIGWSKDEYQ